MNELLEALGLNPDSLVQLHNFLQQHGYLLLFLGVLAEGEAVLALAEASAHPHPACGNPAAGAHPTWADGLYPAPDAEKGLNHGT